MKIAVVLVFAWSVGVCSAQSMFAVPQEFQEEQQQMQQQRAARGTRTHSTYSGEKTQQNSSSRVTFSGSSESATDLAAATTAAAVADKKDVSTTTSLPLETSLRPQQQTGESNDFPQLSVRTADNKQSSTTAPDFPFYNTDVAQPQPSQPQMCQCPCAAQTQTSMFSNKNWMQPQNQQPTQQSSHSVSLDSDHSSNTPKYFVNYNYAGSVPDMSNMLPPVPDITEDMLYKNVNIDALTRPYSSGDNSRIDEKPIQLPDISETHQGQSRVFDHAYAPSFKNQDVVSNKQINTYTNQRRFITINDRNLHRDHKLINVNTNYITNIERVNRPSVLKSVLTQIANKHKPFLYVKTTKTDKVNDSKPIQEAVVETVTESTVILPPTFEKPGVQKFNYDNQPEPQWKDDTVVDNAPQQEQHEQQPQYQSPSLPQTSFTQPQETTQPSTSPPSGPKIHQKGFFAFH